MPSTEMNILELESGTVLSGKDPSILKVFVLLPIKTETSKLIKGNVNVRSIEE